MKKRPLLLWVIGIALILSPLYYYLAPVLLFHKPFTDPITFVESTPPVRLIACVLGPVIGGMVIAVRPMGWYGIVFLSIYNLAVNLYWILSPSRMHFSLWVAALVTSIAVLYFVRREIKQPYFNPRLRWWEHARVKIKLKVDVAGKSSFETNTFDISASGVFLVTESPFNVGEMVEMTLHMPSGPVAARGLVVRTTDGTRPQQPKGIGVKFDRPSPQLRVEFRALKKRALAPVQATA